MELTPEILPDEVEFRTAFRGYEREQVNAFLERVTAAVTQLQDRVAKAEQEAERAEATSRSESATVATVEAAHRTLLMAQRTADEAVREAREEADRFVAEARAEASRLEADSLRRSEQAQAEAKRVTEAAEADARRVTDDATANAIRITTEATTAAEEFRHQTEVEAKATADHAREVLNAEIDVLTHDRAAIRNDLELLDRHLVGQRQAVLGTLAELTRVLEDPTLLRVGLPEGLSGNVGTEMPSSPVVDATAGSAGPASAVAVGDLEHVSEAVTDTPTPVAKKSEWAPDDDPDDLAAESDEDVAGQDLSDERPPGDALPDGPTTQEPVDAPGSSGDRVDHGADLPRREDVHASGEADLVVLDGHAVDDDDESAARVLWLDVPADGEHDDTGTTVANAEANADAARWEFDDDLAGDGGEHPDFWRRTVSEPGGRSGLPAGATDRDDDAFLADVRQAMTDGEAEAGSESSEAVSSSFDDGDLSGRPRKGFGRRR